MATHTNSPASVHVYRQLPTLVDAKNPHPAASCTSHLAGHHVHFIQLRLASKDTWTPAELLSVDNTQLTERMPTGARTWWHHDPTHLAHLQFLAEFEPAVELSVRERFKLLQIRTEEDRFLLSIQSEPLTPCPTKTQDN